MTVPESTARPVIRDPEVSIVVVHRDVPEELRDCLDALAKPCRVSPIEIVVVDDASAPSRRADVRARRGLSVLANEMPRGFAAAANQGAAVARARYLMFLDPAVGSAADGLERLHAAIVADSRLALVAAGAARGRLRREGLKMRLSATANRAFALLGASAPQIVRARVGASAILVRAEVFRALGGFDERMGWSGHQKDLCWRVGRRGYRVALVEEPRAAGTQPQRLDRRLSFKLPAFRQDGARRRIAAGR
jgi:GT2 family glycosyltransferase